MLRFLDVIEVAAWTTGIAQVKLKSTMGSPKSTRNKVGHMILAAVSIVGVDMQWGEQQQNKELTNGEYVSLFGLVRINQAHIHICCQSVQRRKL